MLRLSNTPVLSVVLVSDAHRHRDVQRFARPGKRGGDARAAVRHGAVALAMAVDGGHGHLVGSAGRQTLDGVAPRVCVCVCVCVWVSEWVGGWMSE